MLKIRLMRIGAKKRPFYRVVVVDERSKRNGAYIENVGTYDPMTTPHEVKLNKDRIDYWIKQGAQKSDGFLRILGEAPQRPPRKAKKEKQATGTSEQLIKPQETPAGTAESVEESTDSSSGSAETQNDNNESGEPVTESAEAAETPTETPVDEPTENVIPSESEESQDSNPEIATEPATPRNDNEEQKE